MKNHFICSFAVNEQNTIKQKDFEQIIQWILGKFNLQNENYSF